MPGIVAGIFDFGGKVPGKQQAAGLLHRILIRFRAFTFALGMVVLLPGWWSTPGPTASANYTKVWKLTWSDEFNGPNGSAVDSTRWSFDIGGGGRGNSELETYTSRSANSYVEDGRLVIKALKETFTGPDNITRNYTSARLLTKNKFSQLYGRFEARVKIPYGQGIWPAFWMLGDNI